MNECLEPYSLAIFDRVQRFQVIKLSLKVEDLFLLLHEPLHQTMNVLEQHYETLL